MCFVMLYMIDCISSSIWRYPWISATNCEFLYITDQLEKRKKNEDQPNQKEALQKNCAKLHYL